PADWPEFRAAVRGVLRDGPLTVVELGQALTRHPAYRHLRPVFDAGAGTLIKSLTWQGDVSFGPRRDGVQTLQRLDSNPRWRTFPHLDEAGRLAITAYFRTYGPATLDHLHYWLGEGLSAGRKRLATWFTELGDRLVAVDVDGTLAYVVRDDVDALEAAVPSDAVRFLPGHDQWVIGPGTKAIHITPPALRDIITRKANPVVVGGVVCGTWTRHDDEVTVAWLDEQRRPDHALGREANRLAESSAGNCVWC
ncbi:MAG: crosslink repair DNA glycosylase YcaQ family protein, partial [Ilumatobacteraceae bacterium]